MPFTQHSVPSALSAGKSVGTEELHISEFLLESSVPVSGVGLLASTYGIGDGPGTGAHGSRLTCTRLGRNQGTATANKNTPGGEGTQGGLAEDALSLRPHSFEAEEYRESGDVFGSASVHKLRVRFSGTSSAWHRAAARVLSVKPSFPPKMCSFTQTTYWEWSLHCANSWLQI